MDRYQRVEKARSETPIGENEIRITAQGLIRNYISYATNLLLEKQMKEIVVKAMGQAISKAVTVAEIIKKNIPGLHQDTSIGSVSITDVWEPIEEGLVPLETTRHVSVISISLSLMDLDRNSPGYQSPLNVSHLRYPQRQQQQQQEEQYGRGGEQGRGRGRGRRERGWNSRGVYGGGYRGGYGGSYNNSYGAGFVDARGYDNNQENSRWDYNRSHGGARGRIGVHRGVGYERGRGYRGGRGYGREQGRFGSQGRGNYS